MPADPYVSLDKIEAIPFLEEDVTVEGVGLFRVRALDQDTIRLISREVKRESGGERDQYDGWREQQYYIAFGLVKPDLGARDDLDAALERAQKLGRSRELFKELYDAIIGLTYRKPGEAYKDFFGSTASPDGGAATRSLNGTTP